ncbi:MAG: hypothetical protein QM784_37185 [Polyangiaceae bacterium]
MKLANPDDAKASVLPPDALVVGPRRVCLQTEKAKFECVGSPPEVISDAERLVIRPHDYIYRRDPKGRWYTSDSAVAGAFGAQADDPSGELTWLRDASDVTPGEWSRCLLRSGLVYCWGHNASGQLGYRSPDPNCYFMQRSMPCSSTPREVPKIRDAVQIAGEELRCARLANGQVKCWGSINEERTESGIHIVLCEDKKPCSPPPPRTITGMPPIRQMVVADAGLGVDDEGNAWQWGHRAAKDNRFTAERLAEFSDVAIIRAADPATGCVLYKSGTVACWKPSSSHHFSGGQEAPEKQLASVANLTDVVDLGTAGEMACALRRDNSVWCWGSSAQSLCAQKAQETETPCRVLPRIAAKQ